MLHGLKKIKFREYPTDLLKDIVLFGSYTQHRLLKRLILKLTYTHPVTEKNKDCLLITKIDSDYGDIYEKDPFIIVDSLFRSDVENFIKTGEYVNILGKYQIKKAYIYNPNGDYEEDRKIIKEIF